MCAFEVYHRHEYANTDTSPGQERCSASGRRRERRTSAAAGHLATTEERVLAGGRSPQDGAAECSCIWTQERFVRETAAASDRARRCLGTLLKWLVEA